MPMNPDARAAWVALALTPGIGPQRFAALLAACETPLGALSAPFAFLCTIPGISRACATAIKESSAEDGLGVLQRTHELGARCLLPDDAEFPARLKEIPDAPVVLFAMGPHLAAPGPLGLGAGVGETVAIVGARDHTAYGAEVCRMVAGAAAEAGIVVVSGMARGIDAIAHQAALDAGGTTIGVLGNGLGVIYPAANRALYERVAREGLLLTEFPPGERPHAGSFPRRNRLISGIARATVVVEAAETSGALVTVECALAQGREVLAVPGPITSKASRGANRLIRDGATPLLEMPDLLNLYPGVTAPPPAQGATPRAPVGAGRSEPERRVLAELAPAGIHLDQLVAVLNRPVGDVLATLLELELAGIIEQLPGRIFRPSPSAT
jgi:DNA processing protein